LLFLLALFAIIAHISISLEEYQGGGLAIIMNLQAYRTPFLDQLMRFASFCGFEVFYVMIPLFLWNGKKDMQLLGSNLLSVLLHVLLLQSVLKIYFLEERPLRIEKTIAQNSTGELEFSFPSGHAWGTTVSWFLLYHHFRHKWVLFLAFTVISMTSFSRVYFGVHYPHDVVAGFVAGSICFIFRKYLFLIHPREEEEESGKTKRNLIQVIVWICILAIVLFVFEDSHKKQQLGLFYSLGGLLAMTLFRSSITFIDSESNVLFLMRIILGEIPIFCITYGIYFVYRNYYIWVDPILFLGGFLLSIWNVFLAPQFFIQTGLASLGKKKLQ